jgi:hypothetical protein
VRKEEDSMTNMTRRHTLAYMALGGLLVLSVQMAAEAFHFPAGPAQAASPRALPAQRLAELHPQAHLPAPVPGTRGIKIFQFGLVPSGLAKAFPHASGVVTINGGHPGSSLDDTVTVDVANMPPNVTFTIFFIELRTKPFGHAEYVADLRTHDDGTGEVTFGCIAFEAMALDGRNPSIASLNGNEFASGVQLEHLGMWFSDLKVAQQVLHDPTLKGTPFDGGGPPLHAGPQAMVDDVTNGGPAF